MIDFDNCLVPSQSISPLYWLIPRKQWLSPDMIEKLLSVMLNHNTNKQINHNPQGVYGWLDDLLHYVHGLSQHFSFIKIKPMLPG